MRWFVFTLGFSLLVSVVAEASCFRSHLHEAIALNKIRRPLYSAVSSGKSLAITDQLIAMEQRMLHLSSTIVDFDEMAAPFEARGIRLTCDAFIPMDQTPSFLPIYENGPVPDENVFHLFFRPYSLRLWTALTVGGLPGFLKSSQKILHEMSSEPRINCLTRHFIESAARVAALEPIHQAQAKRAGLKLPLGFHARLVRSHLYLLATARSIDELAMPLQRAGLPIICRDVPHVPLPE